MADNYFDKDTGLYHYRGKTYDNAKEYSAAVQSFRQSIGLEKTVDNTQQPAAQAQPSAASSAMAAQPAAASPAVDENGIGTKHLKTEGGLTYGVQKIQDMPEADQAAFRQMLTQDEYKDKYQILDDGSLVFKDKDGSKQYIPVSYDKAKVDKSAFNEEAVKKVADLKYLAQNTGVSRYELENAYKALGLDPSDTTASAKADTILRSYGYNPGNNRTFYGNNQAGDVGAQLLYNQWQKAPEEGAVSVSQLNKLWLKNALEKNGIDATASSARLDGLEFVSEDSTRQGIQKVYDTYVKGGRSVDNELDIFEWDQQPGVGDTGGTGGTDITGNIIGGNQPIGVPCTTITPGCVPVGTPWGHPCYQAAQYIPGVGTNSVTPVYDGTKTGTSETAIGTYGTNLCCQSTDFVNRANCQSGFYQPQTLGEQQAAGTAPAFENKLYRNNFGMTMYIQHINGKPTQPIPPGYTEVQDIATMNKGGVVSGYADGGITPVMGGEGEGGFLYKGQYYTHYNDALKAMNADQATTAAGTSNISLSGNNNTNPGIYYNTAEGVQVTYDKTRNSFIGPDGQPYNGTIQFNDGTTQKVSGGVNTNLAQVNAPINYQPGGTISEVNGQYVINYPDGSTSQPYATQGYANIAMQQANQNLGFQSYDQYLAEQGVNTNLPGYDPTLYQQQYQNYLTDPSTLKNIEAANAAANATTQTANINQPMPTGQTEVNAADLAQYQANMMAQAYAAPAGLAAAAPVSYMDPNAYGTVVESTAGQAMGLAPTVQGDQMAQVGSVTTADIPQKIGASTVAPSYSYSDVQNVTQDMAAAQGTLGTQSQVTAAQATGTSVSGLDAASSNYVEVNSPAARVAQTGELISGVANAQTAADFTEQVQAATATPSAKATVQGQLEGLMAQFEGGETPAWASGAMRAAMQNLSARGLGASSLAGQAVIQAAMESALPIAIQDAQVQAQFEGQNLSNRQQMAMLAAQQRAAFMQMEFDQAFQARVQNASKIADIANMNFTAEQQIALENSRAANTMALQNLSNSQAMVMAEAAALSQLDTQNLNNRQQAAVQNAQNFLQMDMANLNNSQQTTMFKQQALVQSLMTDQAAANAALQFNASSENQVNQFFANLSSGISQFNAAQMNAMRQFNADEANSLLEFNAAIQNQREMFNAQNYLVVAQANAQWRQNLTTLNNAAANEANMEYAKQVNGIVQSALDELWLRERDILSMAFQSSENAASRNNAVILQQLANDGSLQAAELRADLEAESNASNFLANVFSAVVGLI